MFEILFHSYLGNYLTDSNEISQGYRYINVEARGYISDCGAPSGWVIGVHLYLGNYFTDCNKTSHGYRYTDVEARG